MNLLTEHVIVFISGDKYKISKEPLEVGDHVLDKENFTHGKIHSINEDKIHCNISTGNYAEMGIPLDRLWKLVLFEKYLQPFKL